MFDIIKVFIISGFLFILLNGVSVIMFVIIKIFVSFIACVLEKLRCFGRKEDY